MATTLDAMVFGGAGRAYLSPLQIITPPKHVWRTNDSAWFAGVFVRLDSLDPGENGYIMHSRRASTNAECSAIQYRDSNNRFRGIYNASAIGEITTSPSATTWYFVTISNTPPSLALVISYYDMAGSLVATATTSDTSSNYDDGQVQEITLGARYNGTSGSEEFVGRMCMPVFVFGSVPGSPGDYAADPINTLRTWVATYGHNIVGFNENWVDQGLTGATLTMTGGPTIGSGNGPSVPDLIAATTSPVITAVGKKSLAVIYDKELAVPVSASDLGTDPPLAELTNSSIGAGTLVPQTVRSNSDTAITFDCALGALPAGPLYLKLTNQTIGDTAYGQFALASIEVRADPGPGVVVSRRTVPGQSYTTSSAISTFDVAGEFHAFSAQDTTTYSVASGDLPTGLSIDADTGEISGTIDADADDDSPFTATIRRTNGYGQYAEQLLIWVVTGVVATTKAVGSWGRRSRG